MPEQTRHAHGGEIGTNGVSLIGIYDAFIDRLTIHYSSDRIPIAREEPNCANAIAPLLTY